MASPISLNKPGLNNFNDHSNKIPGEPLPGQIMGDYCAPARGTMEIMRPEGHIMPPEGCIMPPEGCRRPEGAVITL